MVKNWSNDLKELKKGTLFSNYAWEILTFLCTNFVHVKGGTKTSNETLEAVNLFIDIIKDTSNELIQN